MNEFKISVCGNCKHFIVGGKCARVQGEIRVEDICDIHELGDPYAYGFPAIPPIPKIEVNYRPAFMGVLPPAVTDLEPLDSEYSYREMKESLIHSDITQLMDLERFLRNMGLPDEEIARVMQSYITDPNPSLFEWPPEVTGLDLMPNINVVKVPSTGEPPIYQPNTPGPTQPYWVSDVNPYPNNPTPDPLGAVKVNPSMSRQYDISNPPTEPTENWLGLASDPNSEPLIANGEGWNQFIDQEKAPLSIENQMIGLNSPTLDINILPSYDAPQFHEAEQIEQKKKSLLSKIKPWLALFTAGLTASAFVDYMTKQEVKGEPTELLAKYHYRHHDKDDVCYPFNGQVFDLLDTTNRPVIPSEGLGYVTTHPNCQCFWTIQKTAKKGTGTLSRKQQSDIENIKGDISKKAKKGELHTVKPDGSLSKRTRKSNPIREAILEIRGEFGWLTDDYLLKAKGLAENANGKLYLIRAASEAITDHRGEGEPLRRKLSLDELGKMARTAISKGMDINHDPQFRTGGTIIDSEADPNTRSIQMVVLETDAQIINAINNRIITAVSINGGSPRSESVEPCEDHCQTNCELCIVPKGVVLGEIDDVALTWVVTDPRGLDWNGMNIPPATPGVKTTAIQPL